MNFLKDLFKTFSPAQKRQFSFIQILVIFMSFFEVVGIASIGPFMSVISNNSLIDENNFLNFFYNYFEFSNKNDFLLYLGFLVLFLLISSSLISIITTWKLSMFSAKVGTDNADRLFSFYISKDWLFHSKTNSSFMIKQIANEANRVTDLVILPLMLMFSKISLCIFIMLGLLAYDPLISTSICGLFLFLYFIQYFLVKNRLFNNGIILSEVAQNRFKLMGEGFGGIKDIIMSGRQKFFNELFQLEGRKFAEARGNNHILWQLPKYFVEMFAFGGLVSAIIFFVILNGNESEDLLPILSIYGIAAFKFLPAFQQIYASLGQIKGNQQAFINIKDDLVASLNNSVNEKKIDEIHFQKKIDLKNIKFSYPEKDKNILKDISLNIEKNQSIGFAGPSGSGKSTLLNIISGLIVPSSGVIEIDEKILSLQNMSFWRKRIGLVSQSIFLSQSSIYENIGFGLNYNEIDRVKVDKAIEIAGIKDFIDLLPDGLETNVGERGVQMSGGQVQRLGIARALYNDVDILLFDEATSSLDGATEKQIMDSLNNLKGKFTIIMIAHRLKTLKGCDKIFYLNQGFIEDSGTFEELCSRNPYFKNNV